MKTRYIDNAIGWKRSDLMTAMMWDCRWVMVKRVIWNSHKTSAMRCDDLQQEVASDREKLGFLRLPGSKQVVKLRANAEHDH